MSQKNLISDLNEVQRKAVEHAGGPLLIAAGAGSGKTKTLTSRLIYLLQSGVKPENIIAVTFTNKAASEMKSRAIDNLQLTTDKKSNSQMSPPKVDPPPAENVNGHMFTNGILPFVGTFHSLGVQILKNEAGLAGRTRNFTIFDADDSLSLIKTILEEMNVSKDRFNPLTVAGKISQVKNEVCESLNELAHANHYDKIVASVFQKYEELLKKSNAFDFDDLIEKVVKIFQTHPAVLEKYQNQWQQILVDEYQDVNTSQYLLIKLLAQKHKNLFVIGDDAQSIYSFRGSDFRNFLNFEKDWQDAAVIKLEENYRSTKNIIRAASELIKNNKYQKPKTLWTNNQEGSPIYLIAYQNSEEEAWGISEKISEILKKGESLKNIAILYRTNAQSRAIEQALIQTRIPYEIFGGLKFYARKEIKDIVAGLRYAFNPNDAASVERLAKNFNRSKNAVLLENLPRLSGELSLVQLINYFLENTGYLEYLEKNFKNPEERQENIKELINFAATFTDAHEFLEQIALMSSLDGRPKLEENAVKLMTIHLAKGLEFNQIFIVGANDGLLPHERSMMKSDELEEERRLMYVAMTRARNNLNISFYDLPSRFLGELPPELIEFSAEGGSAFGGKQDWDDETIYIE